MAAGFYSLFDFTGLPVGVGLTSRLIVMLNEILNNTVTDITALGFTLNSVAIPVVKRKGVKREPTVDASTQITVCKSPKHPIKIERIAFTKTSVEYPVLISIVSPNPDDWLTNLDTYIGWFDTLILTYVPPNLTTTNLWGTTTSEGKVWDVRVEPGDFLEPNEMANNYDVIDILLKVKATITN